MELTSLLFAQLVAQAPGLLALTAGVVVAIAMYARAPTAAQLVIAGCVLSIVTRIGGTTAHAWITTSGRESGRSLADMGAALSITGLASSLVGALALGLLIAAAFVGRSPQRS